MLCYLHVQPGPGHWSESIPRAFWAKTPSKIPWGQMAHPRLNDLPKTESAISTQMVSYSIASLAFVQPRTPVALLGIQNMIWAWRGCHDSAERLPQLAFERLFSLNCGGAGTQERNATKPKVLGFNSYWSLFLRLVVRSCFASCQNGAAQHNPAVLSMLGLVCRRSE